MKEVMSWNKCEREFIRKIEVDNEKVLSIIDATESRLKFVKSVEVKKGNVSFVVENYYEIIKELLVAFMLKEGLRAKNHQCLFSYFYKKCPEFEYEVNIMLQMSYLRNRLNYYGEMIELEFYEKNKDEFENIIKILKKQLQPGA